MDEGGCKKWLNHIWKYRLGGLLREKSMLVLYIMAAESKRLIDSWINRYFILTIESLFKY